VKVFVDTSAFLAILNKDDQFHELAAKKWLEIINSKNILFCSNYILVETIALLQKRFGTDAVCLFTRNIQPLVNVVWVEEQVHNLGISILKSVNKHDLSLVDCVSFEIMRQMSIEEAFTFDNHFVEQGFKV
jgi:uncharacterized protein